MSNNLIRLVLKEIKNSKNIIAYTYKVPALKQVMVSLLSPQYIHFIKDIALKAPRPTTFQVELENEFTFLLTYIGNNIFQAKISGKQYNLNVAGEIDRASKAIADLLVLQKPLNTLQQEPENPTETGGEAQPDFTPPEETQDTGSVFQPLADTEEEK